MSIQIGKIQTHGIEGAENPQDKPWVTATFKHAVDGPVFLGVEGLEGDQQADRRYHGGPDKAALVYSFDHYPAWQAEGFPSPMPYGSFGENLLVSGMSEKDVCIGDIYSLGETVVQVSQPRQPCSKQARRWKIKDLVVQMNRTGRSGWYLRVQKTGMVKRNDHFVLMERPYPEWPVPKAQHIMHFDKKNAAAAAELAACPALSAEWKRELRQRF